VEPGQHPQHSELKRESAQIRNDIPEGEAVGGQAESGFVDAAARTVVSGKHLA
jgi:hypothetical protein